MRWMGYECPRVIVHLPSLYSGSRLLSMCTSASRRLSGDAWGGESGAELRRNDVSTTGRPSAAAEIALPWASVAAVDPAVESAGASWWGRTTTERPRPDPLGQRGHHTVRELSPHARGTCSVNKRMSTSTWAKRFVCCGDAAERVGAKSVQEHAE